MPHYAAIEPNGNGLMIASYKSFKVVSVDQDLEESMDEDRPEKIKGNLTVGGAHVCICTYIRLSALSSLQDTLWVPEGKNSCFLLVSFHTPTCTCSLEDTV